MLSKLEQQVREFDIKDKPINSVAIAAAHMLGINKSTAMHYIFAKRKGFDSHGKYQEYLAKRKGFSSYSEYQKHLVKKNGCGSLWEMSAKNSGFKSAKDYKTYLAIRRGFNHSYEKDGFSGQTKFEQSQRTNFNFRYRKNRPDPENQYEQIEAKELIMKLMINLSNRERDIVEQRYFEDKTFEEIGKEFGYSGQRIEQIEKEALEKLRKLITA